MPSGEEMHWHEMRSKRATTTLGFLQDRDGLVRLLILSLAAESVRALIRCFFALSREGGDKESVSLMPGICSFVRAEFSPLQNVLAYISSFLSHTAGARLSLLLVACRCTSHWRVNKRHALELWRSMLTVAAWSCDPHVYSRSRQFDNIV
jgi:hypothetical protein